MYVFSSKTFGNLKIGYEIGKKEDRMGNGSSSTFGEFLKVIKYQVALVLTLNYT